MKLEYSLILSYFVVNSPSFHFNISVVSELHLWLWYSDELFQVGT